jgi:hypothetical protein
MEIPRRTNVTELTSDELLLFDFLFDKTLAFEHLRQEVYSFHMNCRYTHGLSDEALQSTLESLVTRGHLHRKNGPIFQIETRKCVDGFLYTVSESGGRLWEKERVPDWNSFICDSHWYLGMNGRGMVRILCLDEGIGRSCLGAMFASGLITPIGRVRVRQLWNIRLIPWKTFPKVQSLRCQTKDNVHDAYTAIHWDVYNRMRVWWRNVHELDSLK